jgi:hypothetical protein
MSYIYNIPDQPGSTPVESVFTESFSNLNPKLEQKMIDRKITITTDTDTTIKINNDVITINDYTDFGRFTMGTATDAFTNHINRLKAAVPEFFERLEESNQA